MKIKKHFFNVMSFLRVLLRVRLSCGSRNPVSETEADSRMDPCFRRGDINCGGDNILSSLRNVLSFFNVMSFLRKQESSRTEKWTPAFAGVTYLQGVTTCAGFLLAAAKRMSTAGFLIVASLLLIEFSAGAAEPCSNTSPVCPAGQLPVFNFTLGTGNFDTCLCKPSGQTLGQYCPTGSTLKKRPLSIVNAADYTIECGPARYYSAPDRPTGDPWSAAHSPELLYFTNGTPLRMCWAKAAGSPGAFNVPQSRITNWNNCSRSAGTHLALRLHVICHSDTDTVCKQTIRDMIEGRVTFQPGQSVTNSSSNRDKYCKKASEYSGNVRRGSQNGLKPEHVCSVPLYDRINERLLPGKKITLYTSTRGGLLGSIHDLFNMQCISNNIKMTNICECNNSDYEFNATEVTNSCFCSDGSTLKDANGNCTTTECHSGSVTDLTQTNPNKKCVCSYPCENYPLKRFNVGTRLSSTSCPPNDGTDSDVAAAKAAAEGSGGICEPIIPKKCPDENPWRHSYVTQRNDPQTITQNQGCADLGAVYVEDGGAGYCEKDHTCPGANEQACNTTGTTTTDHGECVKIGGGGTVEVCITEGATATVPAINGKCGQGWPATLPVIHNDPCTHNSVDNSWSCPTGFETFFPGGTNTILSNDPSLTCICRGAGSPRYVCLGEGAPTPSNSTPPSPCRCQTSTSTQTCDPGYSRSSSSITSNTCTISNCPSGGWALDSDGTTCSKASNSTRTEKKAAMYSKDGRGQIVPTPFPSSYPQTKDAAVTDGWTCVEVQDRQVCYKDIQVHECSSGTYNSSTTKCETPCTPDETVEDCKCIEDTQTCSCGAGWTAHGSDKCRKPAPSTTRTVNTKTCICRYYAPTQTENKEFPPTPGTQIFDEIIAEASSSTKTKCTPVTDPCCHQCNYHLSCPVPVASADGKCPNDPSCSKCLNGRVCPSAKCCSSSGSCVPRDQGKCPGEGAFIGGSSLGIDIAFDSTDRLYSTYSVYSTGAAVRPDYICWMTKQDPADANKKIKVQRRDLLCPPQEECDRDNASDLCQCKGPDGSQFSSVENTYCEYAVRDPMRFEDGIIRGDAPSTPSTLGTERFETDIRFFKQNFILAP